MKAVKDLADKFLSADWDDAIMDVAYDIAFDYDPDGVTILHPWYDPTGRFPLTDDDAIALYGKDNIDGYIAKAKAYLNGGTI